MERIDPFFAAKWDLDVEANLEDRALRLLAEKHKALRGIRKKYREYADFDAPDDKADFLKCNAMINEIDELAKTAIKEE